MAPWRISAIDHVVLRVADSERAVRFYCDVLGCEEERRLAEAGLVQLRAGASLIDIVGIDSPIGRKLGAGPAREGRNMDHFAIQIEGFDAAAVARYLESHGVKVGDVADRYGAGGVGPSIYLTDPDGNTVELKGSPYPGTRVERPTG